MLTKKIFASKKKLRPKKFCVKKNWVWKKYCFWKIFGSGKILGATIRFLVCSFIVDFGLLVLLVTWVIWTPKPSQKPMIGLCVKFPPSSTPPSDRFWCGVLVVTGVKQSQLLVWRLSLESDKKKFGKHRLCVTIIYLVFSDIVDFGGVLLVLLVTWVLRTPNPLNSAKSPWVVLWQG